MTKTILLRYTVVGGTAAVVDIGIFYLIQPFVWPTVLAAAVSFLIAAGYNYLLSALTVYETNVFCARRAILFLTLNTLGLSVNVGVTGLVTSMLASMPVVFGKACGVAVAFSVNFTLNSLIVFRHDPRCPSSKSV